MTESSDAGHRPPVDEDPSQLGPTPARTTSFGTLRAPRPPSAPVRLRPYTCGASLVTGQDFRQTCSQSAAPLNAAHDFGKPGAIQRVDVDCGYAGVLQCLDRAFCFSVFIDNGQDVVQRVRRSRKRWNVRGGYSQRTADTRCGTTVASSSRACRDGSMAASGVRVPPMQSTVWRGHTRRRNTPSVREEAWLPTCACVTRDVSNRSRSCCR